MLLRTIAVLSAVLSLMLPVCFGWTLWLMPVLFLGFYLLLLLIAMPAAVILGVGIALYQRIREIGKREVDDARKY